MFNFLKRKPEDPHKYKMICKNCDVFFESLDPKKNRRCPVCGTSNRVDTYSLISKETGKEIL